MKNILILYLFIGLFCVINAEGIMNYEKLKILSALKQYSKYGKSLEDPLCSSDQQCGEGGTCCKYTAGCYCSLYACKNKCGGGGAEGGEEEGGKLKLSKKESNESLNDDDEEEQEKDSSKTLTEDTGKAIVNMLKDIKSELSSGEDSDSKKKKPSKKISKKEKSHKKKKSKSEDHLDDTKQKKIV